MIYILQLMVLLSAVFMGRHDAVACDKFSNCGTTPREQEVFHRNIFASKCFIAGILLCSMLGYPFFLVLMSVICFGLLMWAPFNIALNLSRVAPKKSWDYVSDSSNDIDGMLVDHFGKNAGKYHALGSAVLLVVLNILMQLAYGKSHPDCFGLDQLFKG